MIALLQVVADTLTQTPSFAPAVADTVVAVNEGPLGSIDGVLAALSSLVVAVLAWFAGKYKGKLAGPTP